MSKKLFLLVFSTLLRNLHIAFSPHDLCCSLICKRWGILRYMYPSQNLLLDKPYHYHWLWGFQMILDRVIHIYLHLHFPLFNRTCSSRLYICITHPAFSHLLFSIIKFCFLCLIYSQFAVFLILNIILQPKTNCPGVCCRVVWKVDWTANAIALKMPSQGSSSSR